MIALAGVALAASLSWLHLELEASGGNYTSFCNVSQTVNCDRVLTSSFAELFGMPVANLAALAYAALALALLAAARGGGATRTLVVRAAVFGSIGAVVFSAYMALVSLFVLETICLMCSGLYVVALALLAVTWRAGAQLAAATGQPPVTASAAVAATLAGVAGVAVVAAISWPGGRAPTGLGADQICEARPEFCRWFTALPVHEIPASPDRGNVVGAADAPVTIVEFFDFECGHCGKNHRELKDLLARRAGEVRVVYRHFPLDPACNDAIPEPIHTRACRAAEAAECAGRQGRFTEMADEMFPRQHQLFESNLTRIAARVGLDMELFGRCMDERQALADVVDDCRTGQQLDITSTPTMFFNGRRVRGSIHEDGGYDYAVTLAAAQAVGPRAHVDD